MIIETTYGKLEGIEDRGAYSFRGIPYAKPPLDQLRFKAPQPPQPWAGVREASQFGNRSLQLVSQTDRAVPSLFFRSEMDEDCLYLNVWTPSAEGAHRPVLVWFHGGGFVNGSGCHSWYDGVNLAWRSDAVVVTANYRLGMLGFLYLGGIAGGLEVATPNAGLLDMAAALAWVRESIAAFGGDPRNVTIFGESAGGIAVSALLGLPAARGLFQRAISQSCVSHAVFGLFPDPGAADVVAHELLAELKIEPAQVAKLGDVPARELIAGQARVLGGRWLAGGLACQPVVDGQVMPAAPIEAVGEGEADVPFMVGTTLEELKLHRYLAKLAAGEAGGAAPRPASGQPEGGAAAGPNAALLATYRRTREARGESTAFSDLSVAIGTDRNIRVPSIRFAEVHSARPAGTYMYLFARRSVNPELGACHTIEIPYVYGNVDLPGMDGFLGSGPEVRALSDQVQDAWVAFARTGNPNHPGIPFWPEYEPERRATMILDVPCRVEEDPLGEERRAWEGLI